MSVQTQIDRLNKAKSDLKTSITNKGVAVSDDALISDYPALVDSIQTGGGDNVFDASLGGKLAYSTFETLPYNIINTSQVTDMSNFFSNNGSLTSLDLSNFDTSNAIDMSGMFFNINPFGSISLDLSNFNTSKVKKMYNMFASCSGLRSLDLSSFDTSQVTDMSNMFKSCRGLASLDLSSFDTSQVTNMSNMFSFCSGLRSLDLSNFNTSHTKDMYWMFAYSSSLETLDLSSFDTSQVTNMSNMFNSCSSLTTVKVINCNDATKQKILTQLQTDIKTKTWTLGEDGIIRSS